MGLKAYNVTPFVAIKSITNTKFSVGSEDADAAQMNIFLYRNLDTVSYAVAGTGAWEPNRTARILEKLEDFRMANGLKRSEVTFVDIGANVGWFSIVAAQAGFNVIAIEPLHFNEFVLRSNVCWNNLQRRVTIINRGLSNQATRCGLYSLYINAGNTVLHCEGVDAGGPPPGYRKRANVDLARLDDLLPAAAVHDADTGLKIPVVKMDCEGHEGFVLQGGRAFFGHPHLRTMFLEVNRETADHTAELRYELKKANFELHEENTGSADSKVYDATAVRSGPAATAA